MGIRKHRTSLRETSVLSRQNIGTFPQRSPMFLISEKALHSGIPPGFKSEGQTVGSITSRNYSVLYWGTCQKTVSKMLRTAFFAFVISRDLADSPGLPKSISRLSLHSDGLKYKHLCNHQLTYSDMKTETENTYTLIYSLLALHRTKVCKKCKTKP